MSKFCNNNHLFFKKNLEILNNKNNEVKFYRTLYTMNKDKLKILNEFFLQRINKNWVYIRKYLKNIKNILKTIHSTGNLKDFEIDKMILEFLALEKKMRKPEDFLRYMTSFVYRDNLYNELRELLLILSNKHSCEILMNEKLRKEKCSKKYVEKIVKLSDGNLNILIKLLFPKVKGIKNYFGKIEYETVYMLFKCLKLIENHNLDPIKQLRLSVCHKKRDDIKKILEDIELEYIIKSGNDFDDKPIEVNSVSEYILLMKRRGHTLWYTVDFIWKNIYGGKECIRGEISNSNVVSINNVELQKHNYLTAIKIYLLCRDNLISNINIFQNFE